MAATEIYALRYRKLPILTSARAALKLNTNMYRIGSYFILILKRYVRTIKFRTSGACNRKRITIAKTRSCQFHTRPTVVIKNYGHIYIYLDIYDRNLRKRQKLLINRPTYFANNYYTFDRSSTINLDDALTASSPWRTLNR